MTRRDFITLLGGAAVTWPLAARAQQQMPVIGYLHSGSWEPYQPMIAAFREGLKQTGYAEGQNIAIEFRWADGDVKRLPSLVTELLGQRISVLATGGGDLPALAAKRATETIPIIFVTSDPVATHLVESLSRPGANLTGVSLFTNELGPKLFELLRELVPTATSFAVLASEIAGKRELLQIEDVARSLGHKLQVTKVTGAQEIDAAFNTIVSRGPDALLIVSGPLFTSNRHQIVTLANHYRIPTVYPLREYVMAGGLLSYGTSIADAYRQSGLYAGRLLKGAKPAELPVVQPTKFELAINLNTAKAIGLTVPPTLLARADEVIE